MARTMDLGGSDGTNALGGPWDDTTEDMPPPAKEPTCGKCGHRRTHHDRQTGGIIPCAVAGCDCFDFAFGAS